MLEYQISQALGRAHSLFETCSGGLLSSRFFLNDELKEEKISLNFAVYNEDRFL